MLFVTFLRFKPFLTRQQIDEVLQRRVRWTYPAGAKVVGEWWLQGPPQVVLVWEAEDVAPLLQAAHFWADLCEVETYPAVPASDSLLLFRQAGLLRRRGRRPKGLKALLEKATAQA